MKPDMYFITKDFPYGHAEDAFVRPEYPYLCDKYHVHVIAAETDISAQHEQEGIEACIIPAMQTAKDKLLSLMHFLCEKDCYIEIASIIRGQEKILQRIYRALMFGTAAETFYRRLKKKVGMNRDTNALFYFYWFDYKCFGLTMHKHKFPNIKIIARTHGYDLYDYRELYGKQFFKPQMDRRLERLIFAAQYAKDYYLSRYGKQDGRKYPLYRLGVASQDMLVENRKDGYLEEFLLLSCSNVISIKRVGLIIDALSCITGQNIRWIHIGDGEQLDILKEDASRKLDDKKNIRYEFTGFMRNASVIDFYKEHYVSCFITTTSTEGGSPVSVQEALSFGIPVIAPTVGELPQMVKDNGILVEENPDVSEVKDAIEHMAEIYGTEEYFHMCGQSLKIYEDMFNAHNNYKALAAELEKVNTVG